MSSSENGYKRRAEPSDFNGDFNAVSFVVRSILAGSNFATLVQVKAVTNSGGVEPVGFVDVVPMIHMVDGYGKPIPHKTVYHLPYMRLQGGTDAIILDPKENDIGIAVFSQNDISKVKNTKAPALPDSARRNDMADGLYLGGVLNGTPAQYVRFYAGGIDIVSPTSVNVNAPLCTVTAETVTVDASESCMVTSPVAQIIAEESAAVTTATALITAASSATITAPSISLGSSGATLRGLLTDLVKAVYNGHTHNDPVTGATSAPNQLIGDSDITTTVKGS